MVEVTRSIHGAEEPQRVVGSDRVLATLIELARHPDGISLDDMTRAMSSPKATVHRNLASLRKAGFAAQDGHGRYILGDEFLRMAFAHHEARPDHLRVQPILERLSDLIGETAHYAVLQDDSIVYRSKVDPTIGAVKLTSTVGGRNPAHCTAVGKLMLSYDLLDLASVRDWLSTRTLERRTSRTLLGAEELHVELERTRKRGYGVDDRENEDAINCLAVPVFLTSPNRPCGAISISALAYRTPLTKLIDRLPEIRAIIDGRE